MSTNVLMNSGDDLNKTLYEIYLSNPEKTSESGKSPIITMPTSIQLKVKYHVNQV